LVSTYNTTQCQNPEDKNLNTHQSENTTANIHTSWLYYKFTATTKKVNGQANRKNILYPYQIKCGKDHCLLKCDVPEVS
jgi:hypothetical protein